MQLPPGEPKYVLAIEPGLNHRFRDRLVGADQAVDQGNLDGAMADFVESAEVIDEHYRHVRAVLAMLSAVHRRRKRARRRLSTVASTRAAHDAVVLRGRHMAFDRKAWARVYMRAYRRGKRRKPRPGYFDKKAWSRPYMREYMRKVRARQKLERERDEAVNAAIARLSNPAPAADLSVNDRLARSEAVMADMLLVLEEMKRRVVEVSGNDPKPTQRP